MVKTICPNCKHNFNTTTLIKVCNNNIAKKRTYEIMKFWKKQDTKRLDTYKLINDFVNNNWKEGTKKTTQDILYQCNLNGTTKGDFLRVVLDNMVCLGILSKIFMRGNKGHEYIKLGIDSKPCIFWIRDERRCRIQFNLEGKFRTDKILESKFSHFVEKFEKRLD